MNTPSEHIVSAISQSQSNYARKTTSQKPSWNTYVKQNYSKTVNVRGQHKMTTLARQYKGSK